MSHISNRMGSPSTKISCLYLVSVTYVHGMADQCYMLARALHNASPRVDVNVTFYATVS